MSPSRLVVLVSLLFAGTAAAQAPGGGVAQSDRAAIASCLTEARESPRSCIGAIAVACARQPAPNRDGGEVACSRKEAAVWRERLDLALQAVAQRLDSGSRSRLAALQRAWEGYSAQKCAFAAEIQPPARAASTQGACELREVALRAIEIERMARRQPRPGDARPELHR